MHQSWSKYIKYYKNSFSNMQYFGAIIKTMANDERSSQLLLIGTRRPWKIHSYINLKNHDIYPLFN